MERLHKSNSRKKFLLWCSAIFSSLAVSNIILRKNETKRKTVKMLDRDGQLVEVDISGLPANKKKASNQEVQTWIKK